MSADLIKLEEVLDDAKKARIATLRVEFTAKGEEIKNNFTALENSSRVQEAEEKAKKEMVYPRRLINQLLYEANIIGISPVVMFDTARISQRGVINSKNRYAFGGGVRIGLLGFDVTTGYSWNINRKPNEGRGAFVFSIELSNMFR